MSPKHQSGRSDIKWIEIDGTAFYRLIQFGIPDNDGLVVQRHEVDAPKNPLCVFKVPINEYNITNSEVAGTGHSMFLPDGLYVSVKPWPGAHGELLRKSLQGGADLIPCGTGGVDENGYVWDYKLLYIQLNMKRHEHTDRNPI